MPIGPIAWGDSAIVKVPWILPGNVNNIGNTEVHACLLAKIMDTPYDDGYQPGIRYFDVKSSNDQAQKNITLVSRADPSNNTFIIVRNPDAFTRDFTLEVIPHTPQDSIILAETDIEITLPSDIYTAWSNGGMISVDMTPLNTSFGQTHKMKCNSPRSRLKNVRLTGEQFTPIGIRFNFNNHQPNGATYKVDLIQRGPDEKIMGGETFIVETPIYHHQSLSPRYELQDEGVSLILQDDEYNNVVWFDDNNGVLSRENVCSLPNLSHETTFSVVGVNEEGQMAGGAVTVPATTGIQAININGSQMRVNLISSSYKGDALEIYELATQAKVLVHTLSQGGNLAEIDISSLGQGAYVLVYLRNDQLIESISFVKP